MRFPKIHGVIRRRLLVNFRVEPAVMQRHLPAPFRPKLHDGHAIAGICLVKNPGKLLASRGLPGSDRLSFHYGAP